MAAQCGPISPHIALAAPWKGLDFFEGSLDLFRDLQIRFPIRHWELSDWLSCSSSIERMRFNIAMTMARVSQLSAYLNFECARDLEMLFLEVDKLRLTHVTLQINVTAVPSDEVMQIPVSEDQCCIRSRRLTRLDRTLSRGSRKRAKQSGYVSDSVVTTPLRREFLSRSTPRTSHPPLPRSPPYNNGAYGIAPTETSPPTTGCPMARLLLERRQNPSSASGQKKLG